MTDSSVPIFVDECVAEAVAGGLRECGFNAVHVTEIGRRGLDDPEQLEFATEHGMALLTYNVGHFAELHSEWVMVGREHCGIILAPDRRYQQRVGGLINDLRSTLRAHSLVFGRDNWIHNQLIYVHRS